MRGGRTEHPHLAAAARGGLLLLVAAAFLAFAAPAHAQRPPASFFGIAPQEALTEADAERMAHGGIGVVRLPVAWATVQPQRNADFDWSRVDAQVETAAKQGLRVLPVLYYAPVWATGSHARLPIGTSAQRGAWTRFVRAAVERYGPQGEFWEPPVAEPPPCDPCPRPEEVAPGGLRIVDPATPVIPIRKWQIWNEENFFYFTKPASPARYAQLLKISWAAISNADPDAEVILGGLFGNPKQRPPRAMPASRFLAELYRVRGIKRFFDGAALHPYAADAQELKGLTESLRRVMVRNADREAALYITEFGWGSQANSPISFEKGLLGQARELRRAYGYLISNRRRLKLRGTFWFSWRDVRSSPCTYCDSVGLFRASEELRAKPAWNAFVQFTGGTAAPPP